MLNVSAKAAALSRRVLESILDDQGYSGHSLEIKIDAALIEASPEKALPHGTAKIPCRTNLGNFAAHRRQIWA